jgi:hypothetical protein
VRIQDFLDAPDGISWDWKALLLEKPHWQKLVLVHTPANYKSLEPNAAPGFVRCGLATVGSDSIRQRPRGRPRCAAQRARNAVSYHHSAPTFEAMVGMDQMPLIVSQPSASWTQAHRTKTAALRARQSTRVLPILQCTKPWLLPAHPPLLLGARAGTA